MVETTAQNQESSLTNQTLQAQQAPVFKKPQVLLTWQAPMRVFKKRSREFWSTALSIAFLLAVILLFVKEWFLIIVIASVIFVFYVLSNIPPETVEHQITDQGIKTAGRFYAWQEMICFWFSQKSGQKVLYVQTLSGIPGRLELLLVNQDETQIKPLLSKYLPEEEVKPSFLDRAATWASEKIPLETQP